MWTLDGRSFATDWNFDRAQAGRRRAKAVLQAPRALRRSQTRRLKDVELRVLL